MNVDRFDRVSLEFPSRSIEEAVLEDLVLFILGGSDAFLHRAPLVRDSRQAVQLSAR